MKDKYKEILQGLSEDTSPKDQNDRILIIDGLNTFIRSFAVNPSVNEDGIHVGGMTGFLHSIGYAIRNIKPTRVIICFDGKGGSQRRRKIFPNYKGNRRVRKHLTRANTFQSIEDERISMGQQINRLTQYLDSLPITVLAPENIEADDAMAYICQQVYPKSQCILMSTDRDFLQLVDHRVQVWSPTKKKFYAQETIKDEFGIESSNFIILKCITGDGSDNIPGIRGAGIKSLQKRLPILFTDKRIELDEVIEYVKNNCDGTKLGQALRDSEELLTVNHKLMQLQDVDISGYSKESIINIVRSDINRLNKPQFEQMILEDNLNGIFKNPSLWLRESFLPLDNIIGK
jgi:DNA polymerase I|tara:strand:+ start:734 stop:1768 length:1035 start_codon:yes stop_codon:yes gene_type:complete